MGLITKTKVTTPSFAEQLGKIKEQFKVAHENASNLHSQMEEEIKSKEAQIATLQSDIETINVTKKEAETFMENISELI